MTKKITPIADILKDVFTRLESEQTLPRDTLEAHWKEIAGELAAKHSFPADLRKNELTVRVDSSVWLQELTIKKRELLKALKRVLGKDTISEIHFKIGDFNGKNSRPD